MVKYEIIGSERWYNDVRPYFMKWDKRQGDYDNYLLKMIDIYVESIKGLQKYQMDYIAQKVVEQKVTKRQPIIIFYDTILYMRKRNTGLLSTNFRTTM